MTYMLVKLDIIVLFYCCSLDCSLKMGVTTVYTRVQVEHVYKSNPIFEAKNTTFLEKV